ncbi:hypothetical protein JYT72_03075 [Crocinitomix catalasitica]|nr:hypothetical protein [Crocinitomix catalasitica]
MKNYLFFKKTMLLAFCFTLISVLASCDKNKPKELPPITETGANTFGCYLDGQVFTPKGNLATPGLESTFYSSNNGLWIAAINKTDFGSTIVIYVRIGDGLDSPGVYQNIYGTSSPDYIDYGLAEGNYYIDSMTTHFVEITKLDLEQNLVSGRFEFSVVNPVSNDTIRITDGRFDIGDIFIE